MPYPIVDLEVTQPLPTLSIAEGNTGIALVLRRKGKPVGFLMRALSAGSVLTPEALSTMLSGEIGAKLLQESIRDELIPPVDRGRFPLLTVAVCTKDRPENLARCLRGLLGLEVPPGVRRFEVLVVDNAPSDDRTKGLIASLPDVRYTMEPKPGLDFARNKALNEADGELLAFLDDDVVVDPGWLDGLMEAWTENPDAAAFTGLVLPLELETDAQILFEQRGGFRRGFEKIRHGQSLSTNPLYPCGAGIFGAGCNMAFHRDTLRKIGGFDEALDTGSPLPGGGDLDIFYRIIRAGYPLVYEPRYLVFHQHRRELEKLRRQYWTWGLGFMAFVTKSRRHDPEQRLKFHRLIFWWLKDQMGQLGKSLTNGCAVPPSMVMAELCGGIVGLMGEYSRSLKRIEQIHKQFS